MYCSKNERATYIVDSTKELGIRDEVLQIGSPRVMQPHTPSHELYTVGLASMEYLIKLTHIKSGRLFQEQVLLVVGSQESPVEVTTGGQRHVHSIDTWVVEQLIIAAVDFEGLSGEPIVCCEFVGFVDGAAGNGVQGRVGCQVNGASYLSSYVCTS